MGRRPTKAANNPFCKARLEAAKYNERLYSKEAASELLGVSASTLSDYELDIRKVVPPDMVIKMASLYNAPELQDYYCTEMCPIGCDMPKTEVANLDRITTKAVSVFRKISSAEDTLLDIAEDGIIDENEEADMHKVLETLEELEQITKSLRLWVKKNIQDC